MRLFYIILMIISVLLAIIAGIMWGETSISASDVIHVFLIKMGAFDLAKYFFGEIPPDALTQGIIWNYRFARALAAAGCGAVLALTGLVLQTMLQNSLAEPYVLGISAGASTGAVLVATSGLAGLGIFGGNLISMPIGAFIGALCAFSLVLLLTNKSVGSGIKMILAGIAASQLFNAMTSLLITQSGSAEQARGIMFWLLGSLSGARWGQSFLAIFAAFLGLFACRYYARALDCFAMGNAQAYSMGVNVTRVRVILLITVALITAIIVSMVGAIGFVGLVIPHACRFLVGAGHIKLVPVCAAIGAIFLIMADICSRTLIAGQVLPVGVVTALVGAPVFAILVLKKDRI